MNNEITKQNVKELMNQYKYFKLETTINTLEIENKNECLYLTTSWKIGNDNVTNQYVSEDDVVSWLQRNYEQIQMSK